MEETSAGRGGHCHGDEAVPAGSDYDVFLSFRGLDTRRGITDHLYESMTEKGIRVFRDDEEIHRGEEIGDELERAIRGSRVYVIVFSRKYASSAWCLRELSLIVDCQGDTAARKIVLPIFHDVEPKDVKLRTDLYRSALVKHRERYGDEGVTRWEEALVKVGGISGWEYKGYEGEGKFVGLVVRDVLSKLDIRDRILPHHLVGIDDGVEGVMNKLNCDSPEVRVVIVHGMGGIGKTTLANVIFNRVRSRFDGYSFLPNVRESAAGEGGVAKLQKTLLGDILSGRVTEVRDSNDGMNQIKRRLGGKKVLIIFDDVSESRQLDELVGNCDFLGSGTRIIVTTRDSSVCDGWMEPTAVYTYEMERMRDDRALQLFSRHAFGGEGPRDDFDSLSEQVVRTTGYLPFALKVIGGQLCGKNRNIWEDTLQKLKQVPHKDVLKILMISYEGLDESEKQIFLDIACFSNKMPRTYANYMWEACDLYPTSGVAVLLNKSLIKVRTGDEFFRMHDLIRGMGREIVRLQDLQSFGMRSRLWAPEDAQNIVRQKEGTNKVLAINLGTLSEEHPFTDEEFEGMSNLRFLYLSRGQFIGDFRNFRTKLLWLCWEDCRRGPESAFFNMNNLIVLKLSGLGITDESMENLRMGNLKALEIRSADIRSMPDLSRCSKLERIILGDCYRLETLHSSVGKLEDLTSLNIKNCESLISLTEELGFAKALRELTLASCPCVGELPESIGRLSALRVLCARFTKIRKLPISIGNLKSLEVLQFAGCPLDEGIPQEIGGLSSLEELNLEECNLCQLPGTIHQLSRLRSLFVSRCPKLRELPELPTSLTKLRVVSGTLRLLPDLSSLTNLTELVLNVYGTVLEGMSRQRQPLQLPWLGKLHRLKRLDLRLLGIPVLLSTELGSLSMLEKLNLGSADISSISQLPSSLHRLKLSNFQTAVPWIHYSNLRLLHRLDLDCSLLTEIRLSGLDMLGSLSDLRIDNCRDLIKLSDLACLRRLNSLHLTMCLRLDDISGLEKMELLEELTISFCESLCRIPDLLDSRRLKRASIFNCRTLLSVPSMIGECYLEVDECQQVPSFRGPYRQFPQNS